LGLLTECLVVFVLFSGSVGGWKRGERWGRVALHRLGEQSSPVGPTVGPLQSILPQVLWTCIIRRAPRRNLPLASAGSQATGRNADVGAHFFRSQITRPPSVPPHLHSVPPSSAMMASQSPSQLNPERQPFRTHKDAPKIPSESSVADRTRLGAEDCVPPLRVQRRAPPMSRVRVPPPLLLRAIDVSLALTPCLC